MCPSTINTMFRFPSPLLKLSTLQVTLPVRMKGQSGREITRQRVTCQRLVTWWNWIRHNSSPCLHRMIINLSCDNYTLSNVKLFVTHVDFLNCIILKMMSYGVMIFTGISRGKHLLLPCNSCCYVATIVLHGELLRANLGERKYWSDRINHTFCTYVLFYCLLLWKQIVFVMPMLIDR